LIGLPLAIGACTPKPTADPLGRSYAGDPRWRAERTMQRQLARDIVRIAPYQGGYPRATRQENCVDPRNDHKLEVSLPWPDAGSIVVDLPEALIAGATWLFLAHRDALDPTTRRFSDLPTVTWTVHPDGHMRFERILPDNVTFAVSAVPHHGYVDLTLTVDNQGRIGLFDLRAQVCVLLKDAVGFSQRTRYNKHYVVGDRIVPFADVRNRSPDAGRYGTQINGGPPRVDAPLSAVRAESGDRAIVMVWQACFALPCRAANPCLHGDPKLNDCPVGEQVTARGRIYFVNGDLTRFYQALRVLGRDLLPIIEGTR
jgi:hypothetical protein